MEEYKYYENGNIKSVRRTDGETVDIEKEFYENGKLFCITDYDSEGIARKKEEFYENGSEKSKATYNKDGRVLTLWELNEDGTCIKDLSNEYYENGNLKTRCEYDENRNLISIEQFDEDGMSLKFCEYKYEYDEQNRICKVETYDRGGDLSGETFYGEQGETTQIRKYEYERNGYGEIIEKREYEHKTTIEEELLCEKDELRYTYKYVYEDECAADGTILRKVKHEYKYNETGELISESRYDLDDKLIEEQPEGVSYIGSYLIRDLIDTISPGETGIKKVAEEIIKEENSKGEQDKDKKREDE